MFAGLGTAQAQNLSNRNQHLSEFIKRREQSKELITQTETDSDILDSRDQVYCSRSSKNSKNSNFDFDDFGGLDKPDDRESYRKSVRSYVDKILKAQASPELK